MLVWLELYQLRGIRLHQGLCDIDINILMTINASAQDMNALCKRTKQQETLYRNINVCQETNMQHSNAGKSSLPSHGDEYAAFLMKFNSQIR